MFNNELSRICRSHNVCTVNMGTSTCTLREIGISLYTIIDIAQLISISIAFFGLGAWAAGVTALFVDDLAIEVVVFGASSVVFLLSLRRLFVRSFRGKTQISSDAASVGLPNLHAGKMGTVTRPIPVNGVGEISVGGSFWRAVSPEAQPEGAQVRVLGHIPDDELTLEVVSGGENSRNPA